MLSEELLWTIKYITQGVGNEAFFVTKEYLQWPEDVEDVIFSLPREIPDKYEKYYDVIFHDTKIICCYLKERKTKMTLEEFFEKLEKEGPYEDMIVRLSYKYDHEKESERIISNELLVIGEDGGFEWLNDWDEGYTNQKDCPVYVIGYIKVDDIDIW